jgi:hypothetical protein
VFILKIDKVLCFDTLLQVLILNNLLAQSALKLCKDGVWFVSAGNKRTYVEKRALESKNASRMLAVRAKM